jgi:hypothetical protein
MTRHLLQGCFICEFDMRILIFDWKRFLWVILVLLMFVSDRDVVICNSAPSAPTPQEQ